MTLVCVPLVAKTVEQMAVDMATAKSRGADLVEVGLDHLSNFLPRRDLPLLLDNRPLPALVTYRPKWEGGEYEGDDSQRLEALCLAMKLGAEYVDVELKVAGEFVRLISGKKPENFKLIVSSHNYQNTPSCEELSNLVAIIKAVGADIVKIATTALDIVNVTRMFQAIVHCQVPIIGLVMHERGVISRLLSPKFGGYLTFATLDVGKESCPGQPTILDLLNVYNIKQISSTTKLYHSTQGDAVRCCDEVDPIAKSIGAVNTIIRRPSDGKLVGYNTDYVGAISAIEDGIRGLPGKGSAISPLAGKIFVVIGAGGAGKALAYGAREKGTKVVIANRTYARARELASLVGGHALTLAELENFHPENGMILANTTSIGMQPNINETPLSKRALGSYAVVFDAVYTPKVTRLLREAEEAGATVVSGLEMFIRQAMGQFELFTGIAAPENLMRNIVTSSTTVLSKI
ncbi:bifunctional 3-dehydroquinate dehydratase/shikimate dehydrogenase, chloroplastic [Canna indica]|uniref:Bifunctional 3-dehydroquinate dehydratase/shikimate dehydrogenase, chloroplastic n=1 Tax=Canna indica TaxID=4628 RepID=A0AAQ3QKC8_9LILI|nr:bifunctional 3-dehydroquinate dehydratase/shikimate dehydrogenase, chloroplastic [Canna indica]